MPLWFGNVLRSKRFFGWNTCSPKSETPQLKFRWAMRDNTTQQRMTMFTVSKEIMCAPSYMHCFSKLLVKTISKHPINSRWSFKRLLWPFVVTKHSIGPFWKLNAIINYCKGCIHIDSLSMANYPHHNCFLRSHFRLAPTLWPWVSIQRASNIKGRPARTASNKAIADGDLRNVT